VTPESRRRNAGGFVAVHTRLVDRRPSADAAMPSNARPAVATPPQPAGTYEPVQSLAAQHHNIMLTVADTANDAERTIQETIDRCGRLDVLVNNAGAGAAR
jgi:NAD(P)-dependent dehydrogenase (short-subunit alcohol dehydrogenase family)